MRKSDARDFGGAESEAKFCSYCWKNFIVYSFRYFSLVLDILVLFYSDFIFLIRTWLFLM